VQSHVYEAAIILSGEPGQLLALVAEEEVHPHLARLSHEKGMSCAATKPC